MRFAVREVLGGRRVLMFCQAATCWCLALSMGRNAGGRVTNAKIQKERAFCKKKRDFLPTLLRSENFTPKAAKPFVSGHFRQEGKRSEIGRKIFEKTIFLLGRHLKTSPFKTIFNLLGRICNPTASSISIFNTLIHLTTVFTIV